MTAENAIHRACGKVLLAARVHRLSTRELLVLASLPKEDTKQASERFNFAKQNHLGDVLKVLIRKGFVQDERTTGTTRYHITPAGLALFNPKVTPTQ